MSCSTSPCGELGLGPAGMTSHRQFLEVSSVRTKKLPSGLIMELLLKQIYGQSTHICESKWSESSRQFLQGSAPPLSVEAHPRLGPGQWFTQTGH